MDRHALAYDPIRDRTVLFGGGEYFAINQLGGAMQRFVDDTFEWNGSDWSATTPALRPPPRMGHAMAFDLTSLTVLLFGGEGQNAAVYSETWASDGVTWTNRLPTNSPPARTRHAMAEMLPHARIALFGGRTQPWQNVVMADLWQWDGTDWQLVAAAGPPPRWSAAMTFDEVRGRLVVTGGRNTTGNLVDTWEWDGASWMQRLPISGAADSANRCRGSSATGACAQKPAVVPSTDPSSRSAAWGTES